MSYVFRTMIVPDNLVATVRALADQFGPAAQGMWTTPLSESGEEPATQWISSGYIGVEFASALPLTTLSTDEEDNTVLDTVYPDPNVFYDLCEQSGIPPEYMPTEEELNSIFHAVMVSEEGPFAAMDRLGLKMIVEKL